MEYEQPTEMSPRLLADLQLELLAHELARQTYPNYPEQDQRLVMNLADLARDPQQRPMLPRGSWHLIDHPNQPTPIPAPTTQEQTAWQQAGYQLDSQGRPLHPWFDAMISNSALGVVTGNGFYRQWGPNYTADAVVIKQGQLLLIKRGDTGNWALPGGFIERHRAETEHTAALRELGEETGILLPDNSAAQCVYRGLVADIRATAHSWVETSAWLFPLQDDQSTPPAIGGDDAEAAAWFPLDVVRQQGVLFGSHSFLLEQALRRYQA